MPDTAMMKVYMGDKKMMKMGYPDKESTNAIGNNAKLKSAFNKHEDVEDANPQNMYANRAGQNLQVTTSKANQKRIMRNGGDPNNPRSY